LIVALNHVTPLIGRTNSSLKRRVFRRFLKTPIGVQIERKNVLNNLYKVAVSVCANL